MNAFQLEKAAFSIASDEGIQRSRGLNPKHQRRVLLIKLRRCHDFMFSFTFPKGIVLKIHFAPFKGFGMK